MIDHLTPHIRVFGNEEFFLKNHNHHHHYYHADDHAGSIKQGVEVWELMPELLAKSIAGTLRQIAPSTSASFCFANLI